MLSLLLLAFSNSHGMIRYLSKFKGSSFASMLHFPFVGIGFIALFAHAFTSEFPFGTNFVLWSFVACLAIYSVFFFFNPIHPMDVNQYETVWLGEENKFSFLVVNYHNSNSIPPGSFFLIYANQVCCFFFF